MPRWLDAALPRVFAGADPLPFPEGTSVLNLLSAALFLGFLLLGGAIVWESRPQGTLPSKKRALNFFLGYALMVSFGAGLSQRELWPFSRWELIAGIVPPAVGERFGHPRLVALDEQGQEHAIDFRAYEPLAFDELSSWINHEFPKLDPAEKRRAARYLLERAENARVRARSGLPVGTRRLPFLLSAPHFLLHPRTWPDPSAAPAEPFVGLRIYSETWNLEERQRDPHNLKRILLYQYPEP